MTRVLIAETDEPLLRDYERFFSQRGFEVATAKTLDECRMKADDFGPDVLMVELDLSPRDSSLTSRKPDFRRRGMHRVDLTSP